MEIAIVGAGWFGCHLALNLEEHNVTLFEKDEIFSGASGHNQNRLHLGFHYPRSFATRVYAREGYYEFVEKYGDFCEPIENNLYAIAQKVSLIDYPTYLHIMEASGLTFTEVNPKHFGLKNVAGCIKVDEQLILTSKAKAFFESRLSPVKQKFTEEMIDDFDVVINCSSQEFYQNENWDLIYEPCVMLNYECSEDFPALTVMDGKLCTIYPKEDNIYTLYSVKHSAQGVWTWPMWLTPASAEDYLKGRKELMEDLAATYVPRFKDIFKYCGYETSMRASFNDRTDMRVPEVDVNGKVINVLPSKVDHIFHAERTIKNHLKSFED